MSYGFDLCFWHAKTFSSAMKKAANVVDAMSTPEKMRQKIDDNAYFVPSILYHARIEDWKMAMIADEKWLYALFNFRFVYWRKYELLGMVGTLPEDGPKADGAVYFQNSCDQNYDLTEWPTTIPFFRKTVEKYREMLDLKPKKCLKKLMKLGSVDKETVAEALADGECTAETAEYHVLSALYHDIFDTLRLNTWLWGNDDDSFHRFTLNAIHTSERLFDLKKHLRQLVGEARGNLGSMNIMYVSLTVQSNDKSSDETLLFKYAYHYSQPALTRDDILQKITDVTDKYMQTEDGKRLMAMCKGNATWADVIRNVPAKVFKEYSGLELLPADEFSAILLNGESRFTLNGKAEMRPEPTSSQNELELGE